MILQILTFIHRKSATAANINTDVLFKHFNAHKKHGSELEVPILCWVGIP